MEMDGFGVANPPSPDKAQIKARHLIILIVTVSNLYSWQVPVDPIMTNLISHCSLVPIKSDI